MNRSALQLWAESFVEALTRRAATLGAMHRDTAGRRTAELTTRLQSAVLRFESQVFGSKDLSWGRAFEEDVAALPRPPVSSGRIVCIPYCVNQNPEQPESWDYGASVALIHDEDEVAAISFGRTRRTLSVSQQAGDAHIGYGGDMRRIDDVPGLETLAPSPQRVMHPFWAMARCILGEEGYGTCFLEGHRVSARGMSPEANIVSVFRRALGLHIENEYGEASWHDQVFCAFAWTPEALERWRRLREPAVRAGVGDPCPFCSGRMEDAELLNPQKQRNRDASAYLRLRCTVCHTLFRTASRRGLDLEYEPVS
ncbi:MAG TPA: hypothetical protein VF815_06675 [Myxococcaceae bacterium]|jgi:hypothetical protein